MDIPRPKAKRRRLGRVLGTLAVLGLALGGATVAFSRLGTFTPRIGKSALWVDSVARGRFVREVRGNGTLVSEQAQLIVASSDGTVIQRLAEPGAILKKGDPILLLANPELEQERDEARLALQAANADLVDLNTKLQSQTLGQVAMVAEVKGELERSGAELEANLALAPDGTVPELVLNQSRARFGELQARSRIERKRLAMAHQSRRNQIAAQQARIAQLEAQVHLREQRVEDLMVKAPADGVLQLVQAELGQRIGSGSVIAKIADPTRLRAELRVPETQAKDVSPGQPTSIDTHNGLVAGKVLRIDPTADNGTVLVQVTLDQDLPDGVRPDQTVEGIITVEVAEDVLFVGRPALADEGATLGLFKLEGSDRARRVTVRLGRVSANTVEILGGVRPGDELVLSDTSEWADHNELRLE